MSPKPLKRISTRVSQVAESATLAIDAKAKALKSQGIDIIGFGAGEPDFPTPEFIVEAAVVAARDPRNHKYTPASGLPELREAIAAKTLRDSNLSISASQVVVTNGGKHAIFNAILTLIDEGDEVLIPSPYWTTYPEIVKLAGGVPIQVPTSIEQGFKTTPEQIQTYMTERTKLFIHVSPSNPTGAVYDEAETKELGRFLTESGLWVMCDEIYEHLTYDGAKSYSLPVVEPTLQDRYVIVNGVAKTYAMTGWRVGWVIGPPDVIGAVSNLQSQMTSNISNVSQRAAIAAISSDQSSVETMREAFDRRRLKIVSLLSEIEGFETSKPDGAFYVFPSVERLLGTKVGSRTPRTSQELAEIFLDEARVAVVPGEAFGAPGYLRLSYALSDESLQEGISRIAELIK